MTLCRLSAVMLLSILTTPAFSQLSAPRLGLVRYADGGVYPITGVLGNYIVGNRIFDSVDALSSSEAGALLLHKGTLVLMDGNAVPVATFAAETAQAVVGIQKTMDSAIAWLPALEVVVYWSGTAFNQVTLPLATLTGEVLGARKNTTDAASLLIKLPSGAIEEDLISLLNGSVISRSTIPGVSGDAYQAGDSTVTVKDGKLTVTSAINGTRKYLSIRADSVQFERVSSTCVHLHSANSGRDWLLQVSSDQQPILLELPAPAVTSVPAAVAQ